MSDRAVICAAIFIGFMLSRRLTDGLALLPKMIIGGGITLAVWLALVWVVRRARS